jgi:hypothetical protein
LLLSFFLKATLMLPGRDRAWKKGRYSYWDLVMKGWLI